MRVHQLVVVHGAVAVGSGEKGDSSEELGRCGKLCGEPLSEQSLERARAPVHTK